MEAKVHEATNNEPWGASSTLLQEIAQGTYNYQYFNEIMPTIYRRFTEKESKQWRQIYKALVLLEYLIKNGSERVIDDARAHISMIKIMRNFFYVDDKGKDEGLNVRNRAKEVVELLGSTDRIREERKLAKKNRTKYIGVGSDSLGTPMGATHGGGLSRYVGFGSDGFGSNQGRGISFNGDSLTFESEGITPYPHQTNIGKYDIDDEEEDFEPSTSKNNTTTNDDDDWGDFECGGVAEQQQQQQQQPKNTKDVLDDDFDDFQFATPAQEPSLSNKQPDLFDLLGEESTTPTHQLAAFEAKQPITPASPGYHQPEKPKEVEPAPAPVTAGIWAQASGFVSLDSLGKKPNQTATTTGPSMNTLKSTSVQADWNNWASKNPQSQPQTPKKTTAFDDLLSL
ncbi:uncharacterized protein B0P05DRAFT_541882 [Gilbertella persicaria]|nr:uncharacterized protein B0P05DRAFT_541882 [Gilbertella persicaria]KAI8078964.1 hypothetical protein B0P05DRAFT_541882 [Gilbertella persicaria]